MTPEPGAEPVLTELPTPQPGPGEVLVRVMATSVNPTDVMTWQRGAFVTGEQAPFIGGFDVAGIVAGVGRGVTTLQVGDCVAGMPRFPHPAGTLRRVHHLTRSPPGPRHRDLGAGRSR
ncbi:zinc-binding alcohol dehydrogenase family protein [Prescottella defluvii]|nr:zinc-binding alcohol dehydrogenase family protein [Prescottella defluvii]